MKNSPLQVGIVRYTDVVVRAIQEPNDDNLAATLPVQVDPTIYYSGNGEHFVTLTIRQTDEAFPYTFEVSAFAQFSIDVDGCKEAYKQQFNPAVIAVNVARILYSSLRDLVASITARSPYEIAQVPALIIEPSDVTLRFEPGEEENILRNFFDLDDAQVEQIRKRKAELNTVKGATKKGGKKQSASSKAV